MIRLPEGPDGPGQPTAAGHDPVSGSAFRGRSSEASRKHTGYTVSPWWCLASPGARTQISHSSGPQTQQGTQPSGLRGAALGDPGIGQKKGTHQAAKSVASHPDHQNRSSRQSAQNRRNDTLTDP